VEHIRTLEGVVKVSFSWQGRNVLVTGAAGLIGSWLVKALLQEQANVVILLRDQVHNSELFMSGDINKVTIVRGELEDNLALVRAFNEHEIDSCFHLGAQTLVQTAQRSPLSTFEANVRGTWNLLEAARQSKLLDRLVVASTDKAYGDQSTLPYSEEAPLLGSNVYDVSKVCADLIAQAYFTSYQLPLAVTRLGNTYGGGDLNFSRIVPGTIRSLLMNESPAIRSDGTFLRDYLYVKDAVRGYLALGERVDKAPVKGKSFNFGTGRPMSVLEMVERITKVVGSDLKPTILNEVQHEIKDQYLSSDRAQELLGWSASSDIDAMLAETIQWYKKYLESSRK